MVLTTRQYCPLFPNEQWSPKKTPKISFYSSILFCIPEQVCCNPSHYLLRVQLLISPTFPMALPARSRRHQSPEGTGGGAAAASSYSRADAARSSSQAELPAAHSPPGRARTVPQGTFPKAGGSREKRERLAHLGLISMGNQAEDGMETFILFNSSHLHSCTDEKA